MDNVENKPKSQKVIKSIADEIEAMEQKLKKLREKQKLDLMKCAIQRYLFMGGSMDCQA